MIGTFVMKELNDVVPTNIELLITHWDKIMEDVLLMTFSCCFFGYWPLILSLTHSFPMHPLSTPWKHQKTLKIEAGVEKGSIGNKGAKVFTKIDKRFFILQMPSLLGNIYDNNNNDKNFYVLCLTDQRVLFSWDQSM